MSFKEVDTTLFYLINRTNNKFLDLLSLGISYITEGGFLWLLFSLFIFFFEKRERKRKIILILLAILLADWVTNIPFKLLLLCRERPFKALENIRVIGKVWENCSFPSGHLSVSVSALLMIIYLFYPWRKWLFFASIFFISLLSFARIYTGMHYPSDVLGGIGIGILSGFFIIYLDKQVKWK